MHLLFVVFALVAGVLLPTQAGINTQLPKSLGHPLLAACVSFIVGTIALLLYTFERHIPLPTLSVAMQAPWYLWLGGLLGAFYLTTTIILAPVLGAATMLGLIVTSQMLASIVIDHFGLVGFPIHPISLWRSVGAILLIIGVFLIQRS